MPSDQLQPNYTEIVRWLGQIHVTGDTYEVRGLHAGRFKADNGYFRDHQVAANAICHSDNSARSGIYVTINPVHPECYARGADCITRESGGYATDSDIVAIRWLIVDVDVKRKNNVKGISATDGEKARAWELAQQIILDMHSLYGWPLNPLIVDSGNGYHILYRLWPLQNTQDNIDLIKRVLKALAAIYDNDSAAVDTVNFNPSRIIRAGGTIARKGMHSPNMGRPHRLSGIIQVHDEFLGLSRNMLEWVALPATVKLNGVNGYRHEYPDDERKWSRLNNDARHMTDLWVPVIFNDYNPRKTAKGWYISGEALGKGYEDNLLINVGIKDFGPHDMGDATEGRRTPISLIAYYITDGDKEAAAHLLAETLGLPATDFDPLPLGPPLVASEANLELVAPVGTPGQPMPLEDATGGYAPVKLRAVRLSDIESNGIPPPFIPNWIDGVSMLVGEPKTGKSFLALQLSICVALGWPFLGEKCPQGKVWYIGLEDRGEYMKERVKMLLKALCIQYGQEYTPELEAACFDNLIIHFPDIEAVDMVTLDGAIPQFTQMLKEQSDIKFVVIDPFLLIKGDNATQDVVQQEYRNFRRLIGPFLTRGVRALIIHHTRKQESENAMNRISGTQALRAAAETIHVMFRTMFNGVSSDIIDINSEMRYHKIQELKYVKRDENGAFISADPEDKLKPTEEELRITLKYIQMTSHAIQTSSVIAKAAGVDPKRITQILSELVDRGEVEQYGEKYGLAGIDMPRREPGKPGRDNVKWQSMLEMVTAALNVYGEMPKNKLMELIQEDQDIGDSTVNNYITKMVNSGTILRTGRGMYKLPVSALPDWL